MKFGRSFELPFSTNKGAFNMAMSKVLGFKPKDISWYQRAFTHRSMNQKDASGNPLNYERLEFLGDAMLGVIISKHLFKEVPNGNEGYLTKMRSKIVSRQHLNELGRELELDKYLESRISSDQFGENIFGNLFEALVGAIYLDRGHDYCERFIRMRVIEPHVDIERLEGKVMSYKSLMIEWCQKQKKAFRFEIMEDQGVDERPHFSVRFVLEEQVVSRARETSKKRAEEKAAQRAFYALQDRINAKTNG
ncbi:MAG: ribonuclease III [Flavobacteriaceae bacterium]|jgi:ribonuclease-3